MHHLYTIGHSAHTIEKLLELLEMHNVQVVCDVRSLPYSRYTPQFNREVFQKRLKRENIPYVFLGDELGPRSDDPKCHEGGIIRYELIARSKLFQEGLKRLVKGLESYRVAMMCAEKDPITCHRMILVCRHLRPTDVIIRHILEDGSIELQNDSERRLMRELKIPEQTLFEKPQELLDKAYEIQAQRIAHKVDEDKEGSTTLL